MNILLHEHALCKLDKNSNLYQWSQEQVENGYVIKVQSNFMADLMCATLSKARKESVMAYNSNVAGIVICEGDGRESIAVWLESGNK